MHKPKIFSTKIDLNLQKRLMEDLDKQGFTISFPPNTIFRARKEGICLTLYHSGSLVVQGKKISHFIEFYLEPEILKTFSFTHPEAHTNLVPHIGADEAGKGDYFGPLCIAALYADEEGIKNLLTLGIRDSKRLSDASVTKLALRLKKHYPHTIIRINPPRYNQLYRAFKNLNLLLAWAHAKAISDLAKKTSCNEILVDQFAHRSLIEKMLEKKGKHLKVEQRHRGETDPVVAAASILARDCFLKGLSQISEEVGLSLPKGAAPIVIETGKKLLAKHGPEILSNVAKTHFKTQQDILSS